MKKKVLLIEDNQDIRESAAELLALCGFEVFVAESGEEGLLLIRNQPDVVISDVVMQNMSGYEVFNRLQADESTRNIPFIFTTALSEKKDQLKAFELGVQNYLIKPYDERELLSCIKKCLQIE
ncbi:response regulator [Mucilaginibacter sp. RS28]|uniref:Response regulator n=1 Tax=Mucilaginibacter straminoryzae TaxID=2932774 RepID=A0A9X2B7J5_9SPHI|nr:response regulator [Mucilaginibacter straminoryzae]MCJ8208619.1 response regulator [Mucilaginibacter straminoryzae]